MTQTLLDREVLPDDLFAVHAPGRLRRMEFKDERRRCAR